MKMRNWFFSNIKKLPARLIKKTESKHKLLIWCIKHITTYPKDINRE